MYIIFMKLQCFCSNIHINKILGYIQKYKYQNRFNLNELSPNFGCINEDNKFLSWIISDNQITYIDIVLENYSRLRLKKTHISNARKKACHKRKH